MTDFMEVTEITQIDKDGKIIETKPIMVNVEHIGSISPHPVSGTHIDFSNFVTFVRVTEPYGNLREKLWGIK